MKIEIEIPDQVLETTEKGLKQILSGISPDLKYSQTGEAFFKQALQDLVDGAYVRVHVMDVQREMSERILQVQRDESEKIKQLKTRP